MTDVTGLDLEGRFAINGQTVQITPETRFEDGSITDILADIRLEVKGTLNADGILLAREIEFESGDDGHDDDDWWGDYEDDNDHHGDESEGDSYVDDHDDHDES